MLKYKYIFQIKYANFHQTALGDCHGLKLPKMLIAVLKNYCVIYYNFRHNFVPCDH